MSISTRKNKYEEVLVDWKIIKELGDNAEHKGVVFQIERTNGLREICALKVIQLIQEPSSRRDKYNSKLKKLKEDSIKEVENLYSLRGKTNIVNYQGYDFVEWEEDGNVGCDLLIRMDYMSSDLRTDEKKGHVFTEKEVIKIGIDICTALVICHKKNILHRDIKPANIFYDDDGDYKLGDFGIARTLDTPDSYANTRIGSPPYAAPEQWLGYYNTSADIYSLGFTLYELANNNCLPCVSTPSSSPLSGKDLATIAAYKMEEPKEKFPHPDNVSPELAGIILKACEFSPEKRYKTAQEMLDALMSIGSEKKNPTSILSEDEIENRSVEEDGDKTLAEIVELFINEAERIKSNNKADFKATPQKGIQELFLSKDPSEFIKLLSATKFDQSGASHYAVGRAYSEGKLCPQNDDLAFFWFSKAVELGYVPAVTALGDCFLFGEGTEQDLSEAIAHYTLAQKQDDTEAMWKLGRMYKSGLGIKKNLTKAFELFQMSASFGDAQACFEAGKCYELGCGVNINFEKALFWYKRGAELNHTEAARKVASFYRLGKGVSKDDFEALKWTEYAARLGNPVAQCELADDWLCDVDFEWAEYCQIPASGIESGWIAVIQMFKSSAEQGNEVAIGRLRDLRKKFINEMEKGVHSNYSQLAEKLLGLL